MRFISIFIVRFLKNVKGQDLISIVVLTKQGNRLRRFHFRQFALAVLLFLLIGTTAAQAAAPVGQWWDPTYAYRNNITVTTGTTPPLNRYNSYTVLHTMNTATLVTASKMRADCNDLRVLWWSGSGWTQLDREILNCNSASTQVWLKLQADIPDSSSDNNYYIYYGNASATAGPANKNNVYLYFDDFESYSVGSPPAGWTILQGTNNVALDGANNILRGSSIGSTIAYKNGFSERDVLAQASVRGAAGRTDEITVGVGTRMSGTGAADKTLYRMSLDGAGCCGEASYSTTLAARYLTGGYAQIAKVAAAWTGGTWYTLQGATWGTAPTNIKIWRNGALQVTTTNNEISGAGSVGMGSYSDAAVNKDIDDLLARRYTEPEPTTAAAAEQDSCPLVSTTADAATPPPGSLRSCINYANSNPGTTISFNIPNTDPNYQTSGADHWWLIRPTTALPAISAANTIIDGTTQTTNQGNTNSLGPEIEIDGTTVGAGGYDGFGVITPANNVTIKGFVINRWSGAGISLYTGTGSNTVTGNYIGTNYAGTAALANISYGIYVSTNGNTIGGTAAAARNVIAGNGGPGIAVYGDNNTIQGNYIGVNANASGILANTTYGINILTTANGNTLGGTAAGAGNVISGNTTDGINQSASGTNAVQGNYIGTNASSASLPNGGNGLNTSAGTINLGNASETQSNVIGPNTGDGINLAGGTINLAGTVTVNGNVTLTTGTLAMGSTALNVSGNWIRTSATVTPGTSTVVMNGTNQSITGSTTFRNLTKSVAAADTLTFAASSTTTVNSTATLNGASGQLLSLVSSSPGTRWNFTLGASATKAISYVSVTDSDASGSDASKKPVLPSSSLDSGNNVDWFSYPIVKQMWEENGTAPLTSPSTIARGASIVFLIYVKNTSGVTFNDVRITDILDDSAFLYIDGSMFRTSAATPPADTATDKQIFDATASGTGTNLSEAVDGDVGSSQDTHVPSPDRDKITIGAVTGQANAVLNIPAHTAFAVRFKVTVK